VDIKALLGRIQKGPDPVIVKATPSSPTKSAPKGVYQEALMDNIVSLPTPSCFLSGSFTQYAWDSTSLGYLKTCPRLYYYHMICGYIAKDESIHLRFGSEYHSAIQDFEIHRASGLQFEDALRETIRLLLIRIKMGP